MWIRTIIGDIHLKLDSMILVRSLPTQSILWNLWNNMAMWFIKTKVKYSYTYGCNLCERSMPLISSSQNFFKFSITGNTSLNSKTQYNFFYITSLQYSQPKHKIASNLTQLNPTNYTRLSSTFNSPEVFSSVGENETLRGNSRFQQQCGLAKLSPIPSLVLLPPSTSSHPVTELTEDSTTKWQEIFQNADTEVWLKNVKIPMERTVEISGLLGFSGKALETLPKSLSDKLTRILSYILELGNSVLPLTSFSVTFIRFCWHVTMQKA